VQLGSVQVMLGAGTAMHAVLRLHGEVRKPPQRNAAVVLPGGKRLDELNSMYLDDVVALLNPTDIERFSVRHAIRTKYCLQVSNPCASSDRV
jgi:hypothetical protein